jgi:iron complex transport system permease protein
MVLLVNKIWAKVLSSNDDLSSEKTPRISGSFFSELKRYNFWTDTKVAGTIFLTCLLGMLCIASLGTGAVTISPSQVLSILASAIGLISATETDSVVDSIQIAVLLEIRAPRVALCIVVGAGLAVSGATMQGVFRNPLADPGLIGVSSGAALAAVSVIVLGSTKLPGVGQGLEQLLGSSTLPIAAFVGGLITTFVVYQLGTRECHTDVSTVLLAGIAVNAIAAAGIGLLMYMADDEQLRTLTYWTMGSFGGANWDQFWAVGPWVLLGTLLLPLYAPALNALLLGDAEAGHLGFQLETIKRIMFLLVAMIVGASVAASGVIGFIGLVVPHLIRQIQGSDYRRLIPSSALLGASLLLAADLLARTMVSPAEMPIGIITAVLGGPFFIFLLIRRKTGEH